MQDSKTALSETSALFVDGSRVYRAGQSLQHKLGKLGYRQAEEHTASRAQWTTVQQRPDEKTHNKYTRDIERRVETARENRWTESR